MENFDKNKKVAFLKLLELFNPGNGEWEYALYKLQEYAKEYQKEYLKEKEIICAQIASQKNVKE